MQELLFEISARNLPCERISVFDSCYTRFGEMTCSCRVYEFPAEVSHKLAVIIHSHSAGVGNIGDMAHLNVLFMTVTLEFLAIPGFNHNRHSLLRFADCEFRRVKSGIFCCDAVEIYVKTIGKLSDSHTDTTSAEVVGFLDETRHLRTAEKTRDLAFFRSISLLHLAAAFLKR